MTMSITWNRLISHFVGGMNTKQSPFFLNFDTALRIQLQKNSPTFNKLNEIEYTQLSLKQHEYTF